VRASLWSTGERRRVAIVHRRYLSELAHLSDRLSIVAFAVAFAAEKSAAF